MKTFAEHRKSFLAVVDDMLMMMLALTSAILLLVEVFAPLTKEQLHAIEQLDLFIAFIFLIEFLVRFSFATRKSHFMKKYWWELLAAIPITSEFVQVLRTLRLLRLSRLAIHIKSLAKNGEEVEEWRIT